jgi:hypothetical protein
VKKSSSDAAVYITHAGAVSAWGVAWRGLGDAVRTQQMCVAPSVQLLASHGVVLASEVSSIALGVDVPARARKLMSRAAHLSAVALGQLMVDARWSPQTCLEAAFFMGVGASGAAMPEIHALLQASICAHNFSLQRLGREGLAACNPLFAFQLMNNFTLCHAAILSGLGGPSSAFFSRGVGSHVALKEAQMALACGDAAHAVAGAADTALHPATWSGLQREGFAQQGLLPGEGAAFLALGLQSGGALARLDRVDFYSANALRADGPGVLKALLCVPDVDVVVLAPWGQERRDCLGQAVQQHYPGVAIVDASLALGDALAASPALAWVVALDLLQSGFYRSALVLSAGTDAGLGAVTLRHTP